MIINNEGLSDGNKGEVDCREDFADAITEPWRGWTVDLICVAINSREATKRNYVSLLSEVAQRASNVAILRGSLDTGDGNDPIIGIVCLNRESFRHAIWFGQTANSFQDQKDNQLLIMGDKGPYEFGFPDSAVSIFEYYLIDVHR